MLLDQDTTNKTQVKVSKVTWDYHFATVEKCVLRKFSRTEFGEKPRPSRKWQNNAIAFTPVFDLLKNGCNICTVMDRQIESKKTRVQFEYIYPKTLRPQKADRIWKFQGDK